MDSSLVAFYEVVEASRALLGSLQTAIKSPRHQAELKELHDTQSTAHDRLIQHLEAENIAVDGDIDHETESRKLELLAVISPGQMLIIHNVFVGN
jgi:hypothetical protein